MASNYGQNAWMAKLNDAVPLNQINYVGLYRGQYSMSPLEQFNRGCRFFDLRLNDEASFKAAITDIASVLQNFPTEFCIVQVKHDTNDKAVENSHRGFNYTHVFQDAFSDYRTRSVFYYPSAAPAFSLSLKDVRGRAIIVADPDLQVDFAFDSPLVSSPHDFWPVNFATYVTSLPDPDPDKWTSADANHNPWVRVNSALQLSITRTDLARQTVPAAFAKQIFFQTWLTSDANAGNEKVAQWFATGLGQVLTHGSNASSGPQEGLHMQTGLIVVDSVAVDQSLIMGLIQAN